jgi:hypothetical protein
MSLAKIISGGQTGADRAALDWAIANGIPHGGWCTLGRRAEDGRIPDRYNLTQLPTSHYPARTQKNVVESDGTLIVTVKPTMTGGTKLTADLARTQRKPMLHVHAGTPEPGASLRSFIEAHGIGVLNVAGRGPSEK